MGHQAGARSERIVMLLENNPYPQDVRVRSEALSLVGAGHEVCVIAPRARGQARREVVDGVEVMRFRLIDGSARGALGFALEYLVAAGALHVAAVRALVNGATVLHLHNPPDIFFAAGVAFRLAGRKVVFDHHDLFPETVEVKFGRGLASRLASRCQRLTLAVANHVIATNASYADVALTRKRPEQVTIVRNAPPAAWTRLPLRFRSGSLPQLHLAYVGAISSQDGVDGLAPVMASLCQGPGAIDARLTIIGDGDGRAVVERRLADHGVADRVTFTGWVPPGRVAELLQAADVCVDPSPGTDVNRRSTMTKIAEYLALGKPVVAYDLLESRRTAGDAALFVACDDTAAFAAALRRLAHDPLLRYRLAHDALSRAKRHLTWEHSERALLEAYATLGASSGRALTPPEPAGGVLRLVGAPEASHDGT
jgi:glycosyltransferase involved in cell wall biosynthesis